MSTPRAMPAGVVEVRGEICARCATPCAQQSAAEFHRAPCSECPLALRAWGPYGDCERFGLGDLVAAVATPIARVFKMDCIDPATNDLKPESPCGQRKADWNRAVPNVIPPRT